MRKFYDENKLTSTQTSSVATWSFLPSQSHDQQPNGIATHHSSEPNP